MQKGRCLEFKCVSCDQPVSFSLFELETNQRPICCTRCNKQYALNDDTLKRQLTKFENLCCQLVDSEEILANTSVGIDIGEHQVKIPYNLLLTRFTASLDLNIGGQPVSIAFRMEPTKDTPRDLLTHKRRKANE